MRNVWRNFLHVGNRFSLTGCTCCAKMPASSSEIFTRAGSCRNKLNRTTSNFTTEMKTACGVIKNQASNRQKNVVTVYPEPESHFEIVLFFQPFHFHISVWFPLPDIDANCTYCVQKAPCTCREESRLQTHFSPTCRVASMSPLWASVSHSEKCKTE